MWSETAVTGLLVLGTGLMACAGGGAGTVGGEEHSTRWQPGPGTGDLGDHAQILIPRGFSFLTAEQARHYLASAGRAPTGRETGLVVQSGAGWFVAFEFAAVGHVDDGDGRALDTDALLVAIRQGSSVAHFGQSRYPRTASRILGWASPPQYAAALNQLEWATDETVGDRSVVRVETRLLGRSGVTRASLTADASRFSTTLPEYRRLLAGFSYRPGHRYGDFRTGDPEAGGGLSALIVGRAASLLVNTGLVRWRWWLLGGGAVVAGGALWLRSRRRRPPPPRTMVWGPR